MALSERVEVERAIRSIFENFQSGDVHGLESVLADDCTVWDVFTPEFIVGKEGKWTVIHHHEGLIPIPHDDHS